jgi:hypothetical protein
MSRRHVDRKARKRIERLEAEVCFLRSLATPQPPVSPAVFTAIAEATAAAIADPLEDESSATVRADGLPAEHPESMVLELSPADEVRLAAYSNDMWPADEYLRIVAKFGGAS